ncbi:MAG: rhomboid family intramembrane serine protease [Deltaproteobacteria bacterium]|nr:rhomboid family intramembrane serine protease [Deltaproteobacteria bacterium]
MEYSPRFVFPRLTSFIKKLIIILLAAYVLELILMNFAGIPLFDWLALNASNLGVATIWQIFTYVLVDHPSAVMSLLFGLLFIWLILSPFEMLYGSKHTMQLCAVGVLSGSLSAVVIHALLSGFSLGPSGLWGSHTIAYAGMAAMAATMKGRRLSLFGLFSMTSNQLLLLLVGLSLLMFLASKNLAMLVGSLGAIAGGVWYVRWISRPRAYKSTRSQGKTTSFKVIQGGQSSNSKPPTWLN